MSCRLTNIIEKLLEIALILQHVLVVVCHLSHADNLATLLQEYLNADIFCKGQQGVQITQDFLV